MISDADYNLLREAVQKRFEAAVDEARRAFDQGMRALAVLRGLSGHQDASVQAAAPKQHGDLVSAVREAATTLVVGFELGDVEEQLRRSNPLVLARSSRKSISTALRRLAEIGFLTVMSKGRGTKAATYAVSSALPNPSQEDGKEDAMRTVSGGQAEEPRESTV